jgi:hypothetical protein
MYDQRPGYASTSELLDKNCSDHALDAMRYLLNQVVDPQKIDLKKDIVLHRRLEDVWKTQTNNDDNNWRSS